MGKAPEGATPNLGECDPVGLLDGGGVSYSDWAGYAWKNELDLQSGRVLTHLREVVDSADTDHNPHHMLERAFSLAAFCMRRMIECRLITDKLRDSALPIWEICRLPGTSIRQSFLRSSGGEFFRNYDMTQRIPRAYAPKFISDKFLHARIIAVLSGSAHLPNGLLIASDQQVKRSLFHLSADEYGRVVRAFLDDQVRGERDWIDVESGQTFAERL